MFFLNIVVKFTGVILIETKQHIAWSISLYEKSFNAFMDTMIPLVADMPSDISYKMSESIWYMVDNIEDVMSKPAEWNENKL